MLTEVKPLGEHVPRRDRQGTKWHISYRVHVSEYGPMCCETSTSQTLNAESESSLLVIVPHNVDETWHDFRKYGTRLARTYQVDLHRPVAHLSESDAGCNSVWQAFSADLLALPTYICEHYCKDMDDQSRGRLLTFIPVTVRDRRPPTQAAKVHAAKAGWATSAATRKKNWRISRLTNDHKVKTTIEATDSESSHRDSWVSSANNESRLIGADVDDQSSARPEIPIRPMSIYKSGYGSFQATGHDREIIYFRKCISSLFERYVDRTEQKPTSCSRRYCFMVPKTSKRVSVA